MAKQKVKLAENKTKPTTASAEDFINTISQEQKRNDSLMLLAMMRQITKEEPTLWSNSYIGFGTRRHKSSATGRESDWMRIGFSPRKNNFSLYFGDYLEAYLSSLEKLGKYKAGMGCLYINKLADVNLKVLKEMIETGWKLN